MTGFDTGSSDEATIQFTPMDVAADRILKYDRNKFIGWLMTASSLSGCFQNTLLRGLPFNTLCRERKYYFSTRQNKYAKVAIQRLPVE